MRRMIRGSASGFVVLSALLLLVLQSSSSPYFARAAGSSSSTSSSSSSSSNKRDLRDLDYRVFPRRTAQEAAVLEWGNSAILTALDVSVAHFGPQTSDAALLEVETQPVLADPLDGVVGHDDNEEDEDKSLIQPLDNADEMLGNMCIMTNTGGLNGVQMAKIAQASGAAALLVVNSDGERQDDIYRLPVEEGADDVDIPVVMISLNSANMLATATLDPDSPLTQESQLTNRYMPDRVRLYAGDDRPFFEDVEAVHPTVYLIHDLLKAEECDALIARAKPQLRKVTQNDHLQYTTDADKLHNVERVTLWQGLLQTPARKQVEERIEQVTAFPSNHYSDFIIDRLSVKGASHYKPRYDTFNGRVPVASMTIFLSDAKEGGEIVYPSAAGNSGGGGGGGGGNAGGGDPIKIKPKKGMVVVHHNTDERGNFEMASLHALLPPAVLSNNDDNDDDDGFYVAHKYIFLDPLSNAQRLALPVFAAPFGGKLPDGLVRLYEYLTDQFGTEQGSVYFEKICIFVPMLVVLMIVQFIVEFIRKQLKAGTATTSKSSSSSKSAKDSSAAAASKKKTKRKKKDQ